jgi:NAD dependent epimerase/dehydratase family enzyme
LRIGNVAGADALLTNMARPLVIDQFADGRGPLRSYIGAQSLARVLQTLAGRDGLPEVINVAAPMPVEMADLAQTAGLDWAYRAASVTAVQSITLDSAVLDGLYRFEAAESSAADMVAQWRAVRGQAVGA